MHIDISRPYSSILYGNTYFIIFIDDYSRYVYVFMIKEKSIVLHKFKIFKTKSKKQTKKVIKIMRFDRGREYYDRFNDLRRHMGHFSKYLHDCEIVP